MDEVPVFELRATFPAQQNSLLASSDTTKVPVFNFVDAAMPWMSSSESRLLKGGFKGRWGDFLEALKAFEGSFTGLGREDAVECAKFERA